jgi:hypothetical protein
VEPLYDSSVLALDFGKKSKIGKRRDKRKSNSDGAAPVAFIHPLRDLLGATTSLDITFVYRPPLTDAA